jgi:hypothetical protein
VAEDWRVTVQLQEGQPAAPVAAALHAHQLEGEARARLGDRIAVSASGDHLFLYADTENAAREAEKVVTEILTADALHAEFRLDRWHHAEEEWEDANNPTSTTPAESQAEHEKLEEEEAAESRATGIAQWELRIEFASHHDAVAFAHRLQQEDFTHIVRRFHYLLVGTVNEDEASTWAERLKDELPPGATIHVEPGSGLAWEYLPRNPFAIMGGLGG